MERADALAYVQSLGFDTLMVRASRTTDDESTGYGPALNKAFAAYTLLKASAAPLTTVAAADHTGFETVLEAATYDLLLPAISLLVDASIDAPLSSAKFSQQFKAISALADRAWARAAQYGYDAMNSNMSGTHANFDFREPSDCLVVEY